MHHKELLDARSLPLCSTPVPSTVISDEPTTYFDSVAKACYDFVGLVQCINSDSIEGMVMGVQDVIPVFEKYNDTLLVQNDVRIPPALRAISDGLLAKEFHYLCKDPNPMRLIELSAPSLGDLSQANSTAVREG
jgi:hypothetical protein